MLVAGLLLMTIGLGLFYTNKTRINQFKQDFNTNATSLYESEIKRTESTLKEYKVVFKVIPILIILAASVFIFFNSPLIRAISITTVLMLIVILLIDGTAHARIEFYNKNLMELKIE